MNANNLVLNALTVHARPAIDLEVEAEAQVLAAGKDVATKLAPFDLRQALSALGPKPTAGQVLNSISSSVLCVHE